jgi:hypothetical protein
MERSNAALEAHKQSIAHTMAGNKEGWVALFANDAVVHDPVGVSPHDPEGKGFRGTDGISGFWDLMIGPGDLILTPHKRISCGDNHCAVYMTAANYISGFKTSIEMIATYEVNAEGKIQTLKVYWDVEGLQADMGS